MMLAIKSASTWLRVLAALTIESQVPRIWWLSCDLLRLGRRSFKALDLGSRNVNISAVGSCVHIQAGRLAGSLMALVTDAEPVAQVRQFGGMHLRRDQQSQQAEL